MIWPFQNYPWTNLHNLNLDWLLGEVKSIPDKVDAAVKAHFDSAQAAVINVRNIGVTPENNPDDNALRLNNRDLVPDGAILYFPSGEYQIGGEVRRVNALTVTGDGDGVSVVRFTGSTRGFNVRPKNTFSAVNVAVSGLTIDSGADLTLNALGNGGCVVLSDCTIRGSVTISGEERMFCSGLNHSGGTFITSSTIDRLTVAITASKMSGVYIGGVQVSLSVDSSAFINVADDAPALSAHGIRSGSITGCDFHVLSAQTSVESLSMSGHQTMGNIAIIACFFTGTAVQTRAVLVQDATTFANMITVAESTPLHVLAGRALYVLTATSLQAKYSGAPTRYITYTT